ncbi:MAG: hypothetical protein NT150_03810 [Bacteroidetes bacterium]|nr:hypothetical protein [Bacteroidota bacterium]
MEIFQSAGSSSQRGKVLSLLAVVLFFGAACKKGTNIEVESGADYIPVKSGQYVIYEIDSIHFDDFTKKSDTFHFQLKEEIGESFVDLSGNTSYRLNRYTRIDTGNVDALPWKLKNVWYVSKLNERYERVEESFRYTRLKFPVIEGSSWNGNGFNSNEEWTYTYKDVDVPATLKTHHWDSTITVIQIDDELLISKKYYQEVYAKHIGLVYKKVIDVASQDIGSGKPILDRIEKGVIYELRYVSHGSK